MNKKHIFFAGLIIIKQISCFELPETPEEVRIMLIEDFKTKVDQFFADGEIRSMQAAEQQRIDFSAQHKAVCDQLETIKRKDEAAENARIAMELAAKKQVVDDQLEAIKKRLEGVRNALDVKKIVRGDDKLYAQKLIDSAAKKQAIKRKIEEEEEEVIEPRKRKLPDKGNSTLGMRKLCDRCGHPYIKIQSHQQTRACLFKAYDSQTKQYSCKECPPGKIVCITSMAFAKHVNNEHPDIVDARLEEEKLQKMSSSQSYFKELPPLTAAQIVSAAQLDSAKRYLEEEEKSKAERKKPCSRCGLPCLNELSHQRSMACKFRAYDSQTEEYNCKECPLGEVSYSTATSFVVHMEREHPDVVAAARLEEERLEVSKLSLFGLSTLFHSTQDQSLDTRLDSVQRYLEEEEKNKTERRKPCSRCGQPCVNEHLHRESCACLFQAYNRETKEYDCRVCFPKKVSFPTPSAFGMHIGISHKEALTACVKSQELQKK